MKNMEQIEQEARDFISLNGVKWVLLTPVGKLIAFHRHMLTKAASSSGDDELDHIVFALTGNEGEDDAMTVLRRAVEAGGRITYGTGEKLSEEEIQRIAKTAISDRNEDQSVPLNVHEEACAVGGAVFALRYARDHGLLDRSKMVEALRTLRGELEANARWQGQVEVISASAMRQAFEHPVVRDAVSPIPEQGGGHEPSSSPSSLGAPASQSLAVPLSVTSPRPITASGLSTSIGGAPARRPTSSEIERAALDYAAEPFGDGDVTFNRARYDDFQSVMKYALESTNLFHARPDKPAQP